MDHDTKWVNQTTLSLQPYPMEKLAQIKRDLIAGGKTVYDFGTGDPQIELAAGIVETYRSAIEYYCSYPSVKGIPELENACRSYLKRRFSIESNTGSQTGTGAIGMLPTRGSKEAIFNVHQILVGRAVGGKKRMAVAYPNPGYPVYKSGIEFAGGKSVPMDLSEKNDFQLRPWDLDQNTQNDLAAVWINYPHNPTGAMVGDDYFKKLVSWAEEQQVVILSDECYADIYFDSQNKPQCILDYTRQGVLAFFSLSKRSGFTGIRSGFVAGDPGITDWFLRARGNFGVSNPVPVQKAATWAWNDDRHVAMRSKLFEERINAASEKLSQMGLLVHKPKATFYLWCRVPDKWQGDDEKFGMDMANLGIIVSPSRMLSENITGFFRLSLCMETTEMMAALELMEKNIG